MSPRDNGVGQGSGTKRSFAEVLKAAQPHLLELVQEWLVVRNPKRRGRWMRFDISTGWGCANLARHETLAEAFAKRGDP